MRSYISITYALRLYRSLTKRWLNKIELDIMIHIMAEKSKEIFENIFSKYAKTDDIFNDVVNFHIENDKIKTMEHSIKVAEKGIELAMDFNESVYKIKLALYLHDISVVIPNNLKIEYSEVNGIEILREERIFPIIIHQKLSKNIAQKIFQVYDMDVLNAIECHTTLKANPSKLDMILFISDKIKWDQDGFPPYIDVIEKNLKISLNNGVKEFINYLMDNKHQLKVLHPLLIEAYEYFNR